MADDLEEYDMEQEKYMPGKGGKGRSKLETSQHTNHHDTSGQTRKIVTKMQNTEKNRIASGGEKWPEKRKSQSESDESFGRMSSFPEAQPCAGEASCVVSSSEYPPVANTNEAGDYICESEKNANLDASKRDNSDSAFVEKITDDRTSEIGNLGSKCDYQASLLDEKELTQEKLIGALTEFLSPSGYKGFGIKDFLVPRKDKIKSPNGAPPPSPKNSECVKTSDGVPDDHSSLFAAVGDICPQIPITTSDSKESFSAPSFTDSDENSGDSEETETEDYEDADEKSWEWCSPGHCSSVYEDDNRDSTRAEQARDYLKGIEEEFDQMTRLIPPEIANDVSEAQTEKPVKEGNTWQSLRTGLTGVKQTWSQAMKSPRFNIPRVFNKSDQPTRFSSLVDYLEPMCDPKILFKHHRVPLIPETKQNSSGEE